jgi:uncharacterized protein (TIGR02246 family)
MKFSFLPAALVLLTFLSPASAQDKPPTDAEKAAQAQDDTYVAAFNKGDAKAVGALYSEDAQYTTDDGATTVGRAAVIENLSRFFAKYKGAKLDLQIESARFLTPDVLVEKGFATVGDDTTRYVCNYVKKDGAWLISELNETTLPPTDAAAAALDDISWLVGSWKDNTPGVTVTTNVAWTKNQHFLRRSISVAREGEDPREATEIIGYDPVAGQHHSWIFDSEGGFGEGSWKQDANKWLISFTSTAPDGSTGTAQQVITYLSDDKFTWESINRQSDGEALPNLDKIEVVRTSKE